VHRVDRVARRGVPIASPRATPGVAERDLPVNAPHGSFETTRRRRPAATATATATATAARADDDARADDGRDVRARGDGDDRERWDVRDDGRAERVRVEEARTRWRDGDDDERTRLRDEGRTGVERGTGDDAV
jgi:hypothetical protein